MSRTTAIPSAVNPLRIRRVMGRTTWAPPRPFGPSGWRLLAYPPVALATPDVVGQPIGTIIVTVSELHNAEETGDFTDWCHASMSWTTRVPTYEELCLLKEAVWGPEGEAYQIHPRAERHVNIHPNALHLWGRADGGAVLPDFGKFGSI